jgi:nucleoside-diphosphate-sugar epimerase
MKKILILGGAGFIGFNLATQLQKKEDYHVTIADNLSRGKMDGKLSELIKNNNIDFIEGNFTKEEDFKKLGSGYDDLYMLAAVVGVNNTLKNPSEIIRVNTKLTINTLEWLSRGTVKNVIFTSTSENYAGTIDQFGYKVPTPEDIPLSIVDIAHPRYTYAVTKILGESGFLNYSKAYNFKCTIVRYHNVIGPRMGFKHVIPHLAERFVKGKEDPFMMYGFDQTRSFCYVDDAVNGTIAAAESPNSNGEIYHIGSSEEISIEQLIKEAGKFFEYSGEYKEAPTFPGSTARRCPDITKAKKDLGYKTLYSWKESLHITLSWYKDFFESDGIAFESSFEKPDV